MADPAPTTIPTLTSAIVTQILQNIGGNTGNPVNAANASNGVGQSYLSMIPVYLQGSYGTGGMGGLNLSNDPVYQWLLSNGYLSGSPDGSTIAPGWRGEGITGTTVQPGTKTMAQLQAAGNYDPTQDAGPQGFGNSTNLLMAPNNPYGINTLGILDVKELESPSQAPGAFGTGAFGDPTVSKYDLVSNTDIWSQIIPLMELAAGVGFGDLGVFGDLGSVFQGLFNAGGSAIENQNGSSINPMTFLPYILKMFGQGATQ